MSLLCLFLSPCTQFVKGEVVVSENTIQSEIDVDIDIRYTSEEEKTDDGNPQMKEAMVSITVRAKENVLLEENMVKLFQIVEGMETDKSDILKIQFNEERDIMVASAFLKEEGEYFIQVFFGGKILKNQHISLVFKEYTPVEEEKKEISVIRAEKMQRAKGEKETQSKKKNKESQGQNMEQEKQQMELKEQKEDADGEVPVIEKKKEKRAVIYTDEKKEETVEETTLWYVENWGQKDSPVKNEKKIKKEDETSETTKEIIQNVKEPDPIRRKMPDVKQMVKVGVPVSAFILLIAAGILLYRRKNVVTIYANENVNSENKIGEIRLTQKEQKYVLMIPDSFMYQKKGTSYTIVPKPLFLFFHKGELLYVSCLELILEKEIQKRITFSI